VIGPEGEIVDKLIKRTSSGVIANNEHNLREAILESYEEYIKNSRIEYRGNEQEILKCTRRLRTEELANVFDSVVGDREI